MRTRVRALSVAMAALVALALAGCVASPQPVVTRLPTDGPTVSASPTPTPTASPTVTATVRPTTTPSPLAPEGASDCGGVAATVGGSSQALTITGSCPDLRIEGNAISVDAATAEVGVVTVSGNRITVTIGALTELTVEGNDITVTADQVQSIVVRGDRNVVTATGSGEVLVAGNDNAITAAPTGTITDEGQRNGIR
ncbi:MULTISPECIES: DUF3060 domain-containing protein [unclassified Microbacterium]|uniref:DUF3060 domain-containing protein n=1 Tax=unclassified Microbacterium TaxID=2609290 RepID=UPI003745F815